MRSLGLPALDPPSQKVHELECTSALYDKEEATASDGRARGPGSFDTLHNHGVALQDLASSSTPGSPEQLAHLAQVTEGLLQM